MIPGPWRFPARTVCGCKSRIDTKLGSSADGVLLDRGTVEEMCLRWIVRDTDDAGLVLKHGDCEEADLAKAVRFARRLLRIRSCARFILGGCTGGASGN